ncbi:MULTISPECIES: stage V sporulation protein AD [unclassified Sporosarcina]|uniref:stage V sporulation protein AD n=1 Tax=unclassified Sporosarcina TaxID=2647733 RepID=UPI00203E7A10|nr:MULTISPECIES: stage V sporulation protein AD [unclassified Sporosarcina]GKV66006.1 stage V sporulation protein AD [Sporosarcina sp. NCCP-2331]GLB56568.1 stage V sporulation protein AD [Sporosarcina sp. NCCP-2378]
MVKNGTLTFSTKPSIHSAGVTAGPLENKKSIFAKQFDKVYEDERCDLPTNEDGHSQLMYDAVMIALSKAKKDVQKIDFFLTGDLVNQMTPSNFTAHSLEIPYIGLFSACATSVSSMITGALFTEAQQANWIVAGSSSQHNAIERQFRYPLEYGSQKGATAQWTVTAAGAVLIGKNKPGLPSITCATVGKVVDMGMTDPLNMGSAMAPAAMATLSSHLTGHGKTIDDYDTIITGDLGSNGFKIFKALANEAGLPHTKNFRDAGEEFYGKDPSFMAGASGSGCSAAVFFSDVYGKLCAGEYQRALLIATGALLSPLSYQQGDSIPCIAHAIEITAGEVAE